MESMNLRNLDNELVLHDIGVLTVPDEDYECEDCCDGECEDVCDCVCTCNLRPNDVTSYCVYVDERRNNVVALAYLSDEWEAPAFSNAEEQAMVVQSITGGIMDGAYDYLVGILNSHKNVLVHWTQIPCTTSDYVIYHGFGNGDAAKSGVKYSDVKDFVSKVRHTLTMKYVEILKDGTEQVPEF